MSERKIVQAKSGFAVNLGGRSLLVKPGDLYYSDDQVVKGREGRFGELAVNTSRPAANRAQETATAGPGERRSVTKLAPKVEPKAPAKSEGKSDA